MFSHVFRRARDELPITSGCLFLAGMLFACVVWTQMAEHVKPSIALERWGAVSPYLFRVWDGQWWRIFVSGFHHDGALHLILNALTFWYFGSQLETRLGSLLYGGFVVAGICVSGSLECLYNPYVGLSGLVFAQFGMLLVLRRVDPHVAEVFPPSIVRWGFVWLFGCVVLTQLGWLQIANICHFSGLVYGWLAGQVLWGRRASVPLQAAFLAGHLLLIPGIYLDVHPIWRGEYFWYLADKADSDEVRLQNWRRAVELDPKLAPVWGNIAAAEVRDGNLHEAWRALLAGLKQSPDEEQQTKMIRLARFVAEHLPDDDVDAARRELREAFGPAASEWEWKLMGQTPRKLESVHGDDAPPPGKLHLPIEALGERPERDQRLPAPDPAQPGSAEEGVRT